MKHSNHPTGLSFDIRFVVPTIYFARNLTYNPYSTHVSLWKYIFCVDYNHRLLSTTVLPLVNYVGDIFVISRNREFFATLCVQFSILVFSGKVIRDLRMIQGPSCGLINVDNNHRN